MPEFIRKVTWKASSSLHSPKYQQMQFCQVRYIIVRLCVHVQCLLESGSPELRVWSSSVPFLNTSTLGTTVWAEASGTLHCGSQGAPTLFFEMVHCHLFWAAHFQPHFPCFDASHDTKRCSTPLLFELVSQEVLLKLLSGKRLWSSSLIWKKSENIN